jgi:hypothetical protein
MLKEFQENLIIECMLLVEYTDNDIFCSKNKQDKTGI